MRNEDKIIELYNAGKSDGEIAVEVGTNSSNIFYWRKRHRLKSNRPSVFEIHKRKVQAETEKPKRVKPPRPLTPLEIAAIEARKRGLTYGQYMALK